MTQYPENLLENIRKRLEEEKIQVHQRIDELTAQDPFSNPERLNDNAASDMEASEESNHDRVRAVIDELKARISQIDTALMRIGDGSYGVCTSCGTLIEPKRLEVMPTATLCVACTAKGK